MPEMVSFAPLRLTNKKAEMRRGYHTEVDSTYYILSA